uniref:Uncharacterized protein n=1 Tax=Oryza glumipatula TaxID=40148 RepID=A0A0E0A609_9ORYZ
MAPTESVAHFDSTLSSLVSSPQGGGDEMAAIGDLIGRLGSICNHGSASANNSCYSTPRTRARSCPRSPEPETMATRRQRRRISWSQPQRLHPCEDEEGTSRR